MAANPVPLAEALLEQLPPQSVEAEMAVLGSMILDANVIGEVIELVRPEMFYREAHRPIFEALTDLFLTKRTVDAVILKDELQKRGQLDAVGGADYLGELMGTVPVAANAEHYAQTVRDKAVLRKLIETCRGIVREATQVHEDPDALLDRAQSLIFETAAQRGNARIHSINDVLKETFLKISDWRDRKGRCLGLPTSYHQLDDMTSGLQASQLYIVAARPSVGKTSLAMGIAERVAADQNKPVLFFSLEMSAELVAQQMLCSRARVNSHRLRRGIISEEEFQRLLIAAGRLSEAPILIDDSGSLGILELRARARRMKAEHDVQLVIVDYLQLVHAKADSREREVALVSSQLKSLAKELEVPVLVLAQLNRNPEGRPDGRPKLSDLRESGALEQDADVVFLLFREELTDPNTTRKGICDIIIGKNRTGPTGDCQLAFLAEYTRFENLAAPSGPG